MGGDFVEVRFLAAAALSCLLLTACERKQATSELSDAEAIQKVAQAVLAAPGKKAAAEQRREAVAAWAVVDGKLQALQADLQASSLGQVSLDGGPGVTPSQANHAPPDAAERGRRTDEVIDVLQRLKASYQNADYAPESVPTEWREQFIANAAARVDALIAEARSWHGKSAEDQLVAINALRGRLSERSLPQVQPPDQTPTLSVSNKHRQ